MTPPWEVEAVELDTNRKSVEVKVGYKAGTLWASEGGERLPTYDHVERQWRRHLDMCGFETVIICRVPRLQTPEGRIETVPVPWAGPRSRFTLLYECFAIEVLLVPRSPGAAAAGEALPQAALVHDRFHISAHLKDAVAEVHREENRRLQELGDEWLKGTQRLFGFDPDKLGEEQAVKFAELRDSDLKSARLGHQGSVPAVLVLRL